CALRGLFCFSFGPLPRGLPALGRALPLAFWPGFTEAARVLAACPGFPAGLLSAVAALPPVRGVSAGDAGVWGVGRGATFACAGRAGAPGPAPAPRAPTST